MTAYFTDRCGYQIAYDAMPCVLAIGHDGPHEPAQSPVQTAFPVSAEHDLQQQRDLGRVRLAAVDFDDESAAALSRVGERIDAQQHRIQELESLVAKSAETADVRADADPYVISEERLAEIRALLDEDHPERGVDTYQLAGAVYDLLAEKDTARIDGSLVDRASEPESRGPVSGAGGNT